MRTCFQAGTDRCPFCGIGINKPLVLVGSKGLERSKVNGYEGKLRKTSLPSFRTNQFTLYILAHIPE